MSLSLTATSASGACGEITELRELRLEGVVRLVGKRHVADLLYAGHEAQGQTELNTRLCPCAEHGQRRAFRAGKQGQAQGARRAGTHGRNGVAVDQAEWPAGMGVDQQDGGLMWLRASLAVCRPEAGRLEPKQVGCWYIARLDAEDAPRVQLLAHHGKDASLTPAVERKGALHRLEDFVRFQKLLDSAGVEKQQLSIVGHGRVPRISRTGCRAWFRTTLMCL